MAESTDHKQAPRVSDGHLHQALHSYLPIAQTELMLDLRDSRARIAELEAENARLRKERDAAWCAGRDAAIQAARTAGAEVSRSDYVTLGPSVYLRVGIAAAAALTPPSEDRQDG